MKTDMYRLPPGLITPRAGILTVHGRLARNLVNSSCKLDEPGMFYQPSEWPALTGLSESLPRSSSRLESRDPLTLYATGRWPAIVLSPSIAGWPGLGPGSPPS